MRKFEALLYRHSDGYPDTDSGVVKCLVPILKAIHKEHGYDIEYAAAWTMHHLIATYLLSTKKFFARMHRKYTKQGEKKLAENYTPDKIRTFLGYGICQELHWDIAYFYRVYPNTLEVYEVKGENMRKWPLINTIKL
jgi:hypothetical protein